MIALGGRGDLLTTCTIEVLTNLKTMSALFLFGFDFSFISEYILRVSTEWRPHVHHSSFRAFQPFDSGLAPIVLQDDETWTSISILLQTLTGSDGF